MGTLPHMSPEQIQGDRQLQLSSDVYGLGAVLYYLLTGSQAKVLALGSKGWEY